MRKITTRIFIKRAQKIHGKKYNYDKTIYVNTRTEVIIHCFKHGDFEQLPANHLKGQCPKCARENKNYNPTSNTQEFIKKAKEIHGENTYTYDKVIYVNNHSKVIITCPKKDHGDFTQKPNNHLYKKSGCPICYGHYLRSTKEFIESAKEIHGNTYNYDNVIYVNNITKVNIFCDKPGHGYFEQTPKAHLESGCPHCAPNKLLSQEEFISRSKEIHGTDTYNYDKSIYVNVRTKVIITCPEHGDFKIFPAAHFKNEYGCPKCSPRSSKSEFQWLNYLNIPNNEEHRQVKIIINGKTFFVDGFDPITKTIYEFLGDYFHGNPKIFNLDKMNILCDKTFGQLYRKTLSRIKVLKKAGYKVISIWESDWFKIKKELKKKAA